MWIACPLVPNCVSKGGLMLCWLERQHWVWCNQYFAGYKNTGCSNMNTIRNQWQQNLCLSNLFFVPLLELSSLVADRTNEYQKLCNGNGMVQQPCWLLTRHPNNPLAAIHVSRVVTQVQSYLSVHVNNPFYFVTLAIIHPSALPNTL